MLPKKIYHRLSLRLSLKVACVIALLLLVSLAVLFNISRQTLREKAMRNAEQTLEVTVQNIDNILLSVEQSAGNVYWEMVAHLDRPDDMLTYSRRLVECNPYIVGCAIVFKPYYYPGRELFMAYIHRKSHTTAPYAPSNLIQQDTFTKRPYTEQVWYTEPMTLGHACWTDPLKNNDTEDEALTTFCLPIKDRSNKTVGVLAVDVAIELLSQIVLAAKPSPNGYSTLLGRNGSYIVHPDKEKLTKQNVFNLFFKDYDPSIRKVVKAMVSGESGQEPFIMDDREWYVVYKPFTRHEVVGRTTDHLGWSVGVVYPEDDIFGDYNRMLSLVIGIAFVGLLLAVVLSSLFTHSKLLPLHMLTKAAHEISKGDYSRSVPDTERYDEIGQLQKNVRQLQQSLTTRMAELEQMNDQLKERSKELQQANRKAQEADRMKTAFLHQMIYQMLEPADALKNHVETLCHNYQTISMEKAHEEIEAIHQEGKTIVELLRHMIDSADHETEKEEEAHE